MPLFFFLLVARVELVKKEHFACPLFSKGASSRVRLLLLRIVLETRLAWKYIYVFVSSAQDLE